MPKHFKKSTKKAWKKIPTQDIKETIGDIRDQERISIGIKSSKNDELFTIETKREEHEKKGLEKKIKNREALKAPYQPKENHIPPLTKDAPKKKEKKKESEKKEVPKVKQNNQEKKKERNLDIWENEKEIPIEEKKNEKPKMVKIPHPGQSYNPTFEDHQEAIQIAHKNELKIVKKADQVKYFLNLAKNTDDQGGDDVLDGIKAQNKTLPEEEKSEGTNTIKERKKKKITKMKKRNINKARAQYKKHLKRVKGNPSVEEIVKELDLFEEKTKKKRERREELKKRLRKQLNLKSTDVLLTEELSNGVRSIEPAGNIWFDTLKTLKNSDLFDLVISNKLKYQYEDGIPIKDNH